MSSYYSNLDACIASAEDNTSRMIMCLRDESREIKAGVDSFWLIYAGALVFFMQVGFAMLLAGSIRSKNARNVLLWNLLDSAGGAIAFWSIGYAFAFGGDDPLSSKKTFLGNADAFTSTDTPYAFWFFEFTFSCATSSIVAGAIAERCQFIAYLLYSFFLVGFVYPVVAHSFWSYQGFFSNTNIDPLWGSGAFDFAGGGAVHMVGGVAALIMAIIIGPRRGRFYDDAGKLLPEPMDFPPHSVTLQFLGTFALWFGWYGFNPGSSLTVASTNRGNVAALAAINTTIAAASGGLSALFTQHFLDRWKTGLHMYDTTVTMNGVLTGLVAITAPCGSVHPWAAYVIGIVAGWLYLLGSKLLVRFRIDDPADAVPVHMVGGAWGMIATGLFSPRHLLNEAYGRSIHEGWFYAWGNGSGDFTVLGIQLLAVIWIFGWVFVVFGLFTWSLHSLGMLRVNAYTEEVGMDISAHKGAAYGGPDSDNIIVSMEKLFQRAGSSFLSLLNIKVDNVEDTKLDQRPALLEKARSTESKLDVDHIGDII